MNKKLYRLSLKGILTEERYSEEDAETIASQLAIMFNQKIDLIREEPEGIEIIVKDSGKTILTTSNITLVYTYGELRARDLFSEMNTNDVLKIAKKLTDVYIEAKIELNINGLVDFAEEKGILFVIETDVYDILDIYLGEGYDVR